MNQEKLMTSGISYTVGLERFAGKTAIYEKYLRQFMDDPNFSKLENEMQREDYAEAFKTAHALKGVIGTLSIDKLFGIFCKLVDALRGNDTEKAQKLMIEAIDEYKAVTGILRECCAE